VNANVGGTKDRETMPEFGELKPVDIRQLWPNEAKDFTPWLAQNIDRLSEALGMDLEVAGTETDVGDFSLDLLARDLGSGRPVVVENQFGATNHDHLKKGTGHLWGGNYVISQGSALDSSGTGG
jgi:hypothetical protein